MEHVRYVNDVILKDNYPVSEIDGADYGLHGSGYDLHG